MPAPKKDLGKLLSLHATSPAFLQRAAVVAVVSFIFFLAMLVAFYLRQHIGYFILSTAFLVVYIFTLIGWVIQKRTSVGLYEKGIKYRKFRASWGEIESVKADNAGLTIIKSRREKVVIPSSIQDFRSIVATVKTELEA